MKPRCPIICVFILLSIAYVACVERLIEKTVQLLSNKRTRLGDQLRERHSYDASAGKHKFAPRGSVVRNVRDRHVIRGPWRRRKYSKRNYCGCWCPVSEEPPKPPKPANEETPCCCCCCCCPTRWSAPCTGWGCCDEWDNGFSSGCDCGCCCETGFNPLCPSHPAFPYCHHRCQCCEYKKSGVGADICAREDRRQADTHRSNQDGAKDLRFLPCCLGGTYGHCGNFCFPSCSGFCCHCKRQGVKKKDHNKQVFIPGWIGSPPIDPSWFGLCPHYK